MDLNLAYPDDSGRSQFEKKWPKFLTSDPTNLHLFRRESNDVIFFITESLIPSKLDNRPPVMLLLGNPASHSVHSGMCFSFEGKNLEHRFWIALRETGFLEFRSDTIHTRLTLSERNQIRKRELYNLDYHSPFRIGIAVYFSIPSPASQQPWSGVSGLLRLFGRRALYALSLDEQQRLQIILQNFMGNGGGIIAFQRDAYEGIRTPDTPAYHIELAGRGELRGKCKLDPKKHLLGALPTRYLHSAKGKEVLSRLKGYLIRVTKH